MRAAAAALMISAAAPASAERNVSLYPAAQCAAFWLGFSDYARASAHLDLNPDDVARAHAFVQVALRLGTATQDEIEDHIRTQRRLMVSLLDGVIYRSDDVSQRVFERLTETCKNFGRAQPETRELS